MPAASSVGLAMGGPKPTSSGGDSSSGEEDGDAEWKAAIQSIAATTTASFTANGFKNTSSNSSTTTKNNLGSHSTQAINGDGDEDASEGEQKQNPQKLKHYQIKAQKLLDQMLEKTLEIVKDANNVPEEDSVVDDGGVRLFRNSTPGIVFDRNSLVVG
ncbi:hypothetical protein COLO4_11574 [Corchorus olitorius]|uniref:Uncharacterized protein n=1 Tax=Corchorus olitorius TaxID=93759 RepID=A0A1R3K418_9ROSI|nr:hypothetical protein COLO4_11574 [Corchorus olitorius]